MVPVGAEEDTREKGTGHTWAGVEESVPLPDGGMSPPLRSPSRLPHLAAETPISSEMPLDPEKGDIRVAQAGLSRALSTGPGGT